MAAQARSREPLVGMPTLPLHVGRANVAALRDHNHHSSQAAVHVMANARALLATVIGRRAPRASVKQRARVTHALAPTSARPRDPSDGTEGGTASPGTRSSRTAAVKRPVVGLGAPSGLAQQEPHRGCSVTPET